MNGEWRDFLERAGAHWDGDSVMHFGQPDGESNAALTGDVCCDLSHLGLIIARGPDTERFLQGQLTGDVRQATLERSLIGAHCNPKGRVLANLGLFRREDAYYLELPQAMVDATLSRLCKYLLRAKAVLEDASTSRNFSRQSGTRSSLEVSNPYPISRKSSFATGSIGRKISS